MRSKHFRRLINVDGGRQFMLQCIAFGLLQLPIVAAVLHFGQPNSSNHYLAAFEDKRRLLIETDGPRLVLMGGSNVAFGIDSQVLNRHTGRHPINLGLMAPLGLQYQMALVQRHGRRGDQVVICPEYETINSSLQPYDTKSVADLCLNVPLARTYFPDYVEPGWRDFFDTESLQQSNQWVMRAVTNARHQGRKPKLFSRGSFNASGDMVAHYGRAAKAFDSTQPVSPPTPAALASTIDQINRFVAHCDQRGIAVAFSFPPIPVTRVDASADALVAVQTELVKSLRCPVLGTTRTFAWDDDQFYDSVYHAVESAATRRSETLATLMQAGKQRR